MLACSVVREVITRSDNLAPILHSFGRNICKQISFQRFNSGIKSTPRCTEWSSFNMIGLIASKFSNSNRTENRAGGKNLGLGDIFLSTCVDVFTI